MAIVATLDIVFGARTAKAEKGFAKVSTLSDKLTNKIKGLAAAYLSFRAAQAAGSALIDFAANSVKAAAGAQKAAVGFEVLTGSAEKAAETMKTLRQFAATTPFRSDEVRAAGRRLLAAGISTEQLTDRLTLLGNASAATGARLLDVVAIYSKIQNQNKLTGETFEQLAERSINVAPAIQKNLGITADEFLKLRAAGKVTARDVENALRTMSAEGGMFAGAIEKLGQTAAGRFSTLQDKVQQFSKAFGQGLLPSMERFLATTIGAVDNAEGLNVVLFNLGRTIGFVVDNINLAVLGFQQFTSEVKGLTNVIKALDLTGFVRDTERLVNVVQFAANAASILRGGSGAEAPAEKMAENLKTANDEAGKLQRKADSLSRSLRTPFEVMKDSLQEIRTLVTGGVLDPDIAGRGIRQALDRFKQAIKSQEFTIKANLPGATRGSQEALAIRFGRELTNSREIAQQSLQAEQEAAATLGSIEGLLQNQQRIQPANIGG